MFFAEIILGDYTKRSAEKLIKPPLNPDTGLEYDSVVGFTKGSNVFMVYSNLKCYPRYLVTYK
jgi:hypothetical protein